ncbi:hypothetical protein Taro_014751 [Colocasia esculenta]|uniref:Uncharacterized protein n=1 Tax=Colocasia esculenta TaxID=4460 RepID=A0A843U9U3_COLES|nr:hypothetical protein [Colocasia esculenta]
MASTHWLEHLAKDCQVYKNNPQKTTGLFSFGRPKEEKLKSHHHPQREATAPTQFSQPEGQRGQPTNLTSPTRARRLLRASERSGDGEETNRPQVVPLVLPHPRYVVPLLLAIPVPADPVLSGSL